MDNALEKHGIDWHCIAPGKPMQNAFVASFNGRIIRSPLGLLTKNVNPAEGGFRRGQIPGTLQAMD